MATELKSGRKLDDKLRLSINLGCWDWLDIIIGIDGTIFTRVNRRDRKGGYRFDPLSSDVTDKVLKALDCKLTYDKIVKIIEIVEAVTDVK